MSRLAYQPQQAAENRRQRFVSEYLIDMNVEQAAIRAGYAPSGARTTGSRLLRDPKVAEAVRCELDARCKRVRVDADEVLRELIAIVRLCPTDALVQTEDGTWVTSLERLPEGTRHLVQEVQIKSNGQVVLRFPSKLKALELIGKHVEVRAFEKRISIETNTAKEVVRRLQEGRRRARAA